MSNETYIQIRQDYEKDGKTKYRTLETIILTDEQMEFLESSRNVEVNGMSVELPLGYLIKGIILAALKSEE